MEEMQEENKNFSIYFTKREQRLHKCYDKNSKKDRLKKNQ